MSQVLAIEIDDGQMKLVLKALSDRKNFTIKGAFIGEVVLESVHVTLTDSDGLQSKIVPITRQCNMDDFTKIDKSFESNHNWVQQGTCLNGPHVWRCTKCLEWTRSFDKPNPDTQLIDPDNGERYSAKVCR